MSSINDVSNVRIKSSQAFLLSFRYMLETFSLLVPYPHSYLVLNSSKHLIPDMRLYTGIFQDDQLLVFEKTKKLY
jgi:hypothetical protein